MLYEKSNLYGLLFFYLLFCRLFAGRKSQKVGEHGAHAIDVDSGRIRDNGG